MIKHGMNKGHNPKINELINLINIVKIIKKITNINKTNEANTPIINFIMKLPIFSVSNLNPSNICPIKAIARSYKPIKNYK